MSIDSRLITLKDIVDKKYFFNVPIYQRLYVWGDDQVKTLLFDLWEAYQSNEKPSYYLGGTIVVERETDNGSNGSRHFDLIDGQQRFTTLWLISLVWGENLSEYCSTDSSHRINFSIRPEVKKFFHAYFINPDEGGSDISSFDLSQLENALATIKSFPSQIEDTKKVSFDKKGFTKFIFEKVTLILTSVPKNIDLNKLFEVINNRGVQLQHHEILKARLLDKIDTEEREKYSQLWDACSYMDDYVEKNLNNLSSLKPSTLFDNEASKKNEEQLICAKDVLEHVAEKLESEVSSAISLEVILNTNVENEKNDNHKVTDKEVIGTYSVRSIISFPMLLQHVLRIWLLKNNKEDLPKILDKELLSIFEAAWPKSSIKKSEVKSFIELLWEIRYLFDKYIIKWVKDENDEVHAIRPLQKNRSKEYYSLTREKPSSAINEWTGLSLLQSMLYHSQQITTHYWLTPLLSYLHQEKPDTENLYRYLRHLDNHLLCSDDDRALIDRTHDFIIEPNKTSNLSTSLLKENSGVGFPHYWFYKLEFVLWFYRDSIDEDEKNIGRWNHFRMTAKNSVEHISPQTKQTIDTNIVSDKCLDSFGNLALVSRSLNSEYGNLPYNEKRQRFFNKNVNDVDSLKMDLIYRNETWGDEQAKAHQDMVVEKLEDYLQKESKFFNKVSS